MPLLYGPFNFRWEYPFRLARIQDLYYVVSFQRVSGRIYCEDLLREGG
jgi:hypothetical protein